MAPRRMLFLISRPFKSTLILRSRQFAPPKIYARLKFQGNCRYLHADDNAFLCLLLSWNQRRGESWLANGTRNEAPRFMPAIEEDYVRSRGLRFATANEGIFRKMARPEINWGPCITRYFTKVCQTFHGWAEQSICGTLSFWIQRPSIRVCCKINAQGPKRKGAKFESSLGKFRLG